MIGNWPNTPEPEEANLLLLNRSSGGNWLEVQLAGTASNRAAIGARIEVTAAGGDRTVRQVREVQAHTAWRSQGDLVQHFGLGKLDTVDVAVRWSSGREDRRPAVAAGQRIVIVEGR